jgi:antirestriction protein ArdC
MERYERTGDFYGSLFHEIMHATGHPDRLNRFEIDGNSNDLSGYAKEELVAEIGSAMICALVGVEPTTDNDAAYVKYWLKVLKDETNVRLVTHAGACAQKAIDYLTGATFGEDE